MNVRVVRLVLLGAVGIVAFIALTGSGGDRYHLEIRVADAEGIHSGSPIVIGGVPVGSVNVSLRPDGKVDLDLAIDRAHAPVSRNASMAIRAINLLGQKQLQLISSNASADPAPSGYRIPSNRLTVSTDLDQTLDVLDPSTRVRLGILLNEAGLAVTGRRGDIGHLIAELPGGLSDVQRVLDAVDSDNRALGNLVQTSGQAVSAFNAQRNGLNQLVDTLARAGSNISSQHANLERTVQDVPPTLATLQTTLGRLDALTVPLRPAARLLAATAPRLSQTLAQLPAFQRAAVPTLDRATRVSGDLVTLANRATPVLGRAVPVTDTLATLTATALPPVTNVLDHSEDNVFAILDNWSRAVQFRDGMGHIFRGSASFNPDILDSLIRRALGQSGASRAVKVANNRSASPPAGPGVASPGQAPAGASAPPAPTAGKPNPGSSSSVTALINFLLKP